MSEGMVLVRSGTVEDMERIGVIQNRCPEASNWAPETYLQYYLLVAALKSEVAGFVVWREVGPEEAEILNIAVDPDFRRRGVATTLLEAVRAQFSGSLFLEVRESNVAARLLYERLGFEVAGRRPGYYNSPPEAALVMRLS